MSIMRWRCNSAWEAVIASSHDLPVYLDDEASELCRLNGIHRRLLAANARILQLNGKGDDECGTSSCVVVCCRFVTVKDLEIVCSTLATSSHSECIFFTATHEDLLPTSEIPCDNYEEVEAELKQALQRAKQEAELCHVDIQHFKACAAAINPDIILMPAFHQLPLLWPGDTAVLGKSLGDINLSLLPEQWQTELRLFVSSLNCLFAELDICEDSYSVGHMSRLVAMELASLPSAKARRKATSQKASLILVDRTLDLVGCTTHSSDCLADRILGLLPKFSETSSDVEVNMSAMFSSDVNYSTDALMPGSLYHADSAMAQGLLHSFISSREKEAIMEISRLLLDTMAKEHIEVESAGRVARMTVDRLKGFVRKFSSKPQSLVKHCCWLECALAAINTLESQDGALRERLLGTEKVLLLGLGDSGSASPLSQVCSLMQSERQGRNLPVDKVLLLCIFLYSLLPKELRGTSEEEDKLKSALVNSILKWAREEQASFIGKSGSVRQKVDALFTNLNAFGDARSHLKQLSTLLLPQGVGERRVYEPLVKQIIEAAVDPKKPDLSDIAYQSHGLRDYLKTSLTFGFSKFMNVGKSHPGNHPLIFLFVVGGVTLGEVKQIREAVIAAKTSIEVVIVSNRILSPGDVYRDLVTTDRRLA
eukprot:m.192070 g.192070  ORF g.192070 m.192070 type:complete len:651 (+) comp39461_c1_seq6:85-2037(+)